MKRQAAFADRLRALAPSNWTDFLFVDELAVDREGGLRLLATPASFQAVHDPNPASALVCPLSSQRSLFLCRMHTAQALRVLSASPLSGEFVAEDWADLLDSEPEIARLALGFDLEHPTLTGGFTRVRMSAADAPPDARVVDVHPPIAFAGDTVLDLSPRLPQALALLPPSVPVCDDAPDADPDQLHLFFISNMSVDLGGERSLDLGFGARWWTATSYPGLESVSAAFRSFEPRMAVERLLGGVIAFDQRADPPTAEARRQEADDCLTRVRRLCTLLNVVHGAVPYLVARRSVLERRPQIVNEMREVYTNIVQRHRSIPFARVPKRLAAAELTEVSALSLSGTLRKGLPLQLQRAADSLTVARQLSDRSLAHVLTWAAIEAIISQKESELIANMTLCLLGLNAPVSSATDFWVSSKSSYSTRSSIVHGFDVPDPQTLARVSQFTEEQAHRLLKLVCKRVSEPGLTRERLTDELRALALRGGELPAGAFGTGSA